MNDVTQQIRDRLDGLAQLPAAFLEVSDRISPAEIEKWQAEWDEMLAGQPKVQILAPRAQFDPPAEPMRDAILAVLELHAARTQSGDWERGPYWACEQCVENEDPCPTLRAIAEKLGIEAADA